MVQRERRARWTNWAWLPIAGAFLIWGGRALWSAGGAYSSAGHGSSTTGVNRVPALYAQGDCGHCHEAHAGQDGNTTPFRYTLFAQEEDACWACHDGSVTYAADVRSPFALTPANTTTDYYKHPVSSAYSGITPSAHRAGETQASAFGGASRHAECTDCHDPHSARNDGTPGSSTHTPGSPTGNLISGALVGATGLVVTSWQAAGQPFAGAAYTLQKLTDTSAHMEWQICLKCHSTFTTLPTYTTVGSGDYQANKITSTAATQVKEYDDLGQAFNPNNASYHPVVTAGRNTSIPAASFASPWSHTSTMQCGDCHSRAAGAAGGVGPHGSSYMHLLERPLYLRENQHYRDPSGRNIGHDPNELCFKCHRWQTYMQKNADPATNTNFRGGTKNLHTFHLVDINGTTCYTCHDVHGSNKEFLINFNTATVTSASGSQGAYTRTSTGGSCSLTCHGKSHNPIRYTR